MALDSIVILKNLATGEVVVLIQYHPPPSEVMIDYVLNPREKMKRSLVEKLPSGWVGRVHAPLGPRFLLQYQHSTNECR